ncbi:MAG: type II CAAX prenyl endopeptidase Rce1 family protein [Oscillibacter sp.]
MLQYLVPGLVLAWVYDRTGTLWTSIGLHAWRPTPSPLGPLWRKNRIPE